MDLTLLPYVIVTDILRMWKETAHLLGSCWATSLIQTRDSSSDGAELLFCVVTWVWFWDHPDRSEVLSH